VRTTAAWAAMALLLSLSSSPRAARAADEAAPLAAVLDRIERHAVEVSLQFQRDLSAEADGAPPPDPDSSSEVFRRWRMSLRVPGFVVRDRRTVVASDLFLPPGAVKSVEVTGRDGTTVAARLQAFLPRCGGVVLVTEKDLTTEPVPFGDAADAAGAAALFVGSLAEGARGLETWAESLGTSRRRAFRGGGTSWGKPERPTAGLAGAVASRTVDLVVREDGTPLGVRFGAALDLGTSVWQGANVVAELAQAVPFARLGERAKEMAEGSFVHQVRIAFRPASGESPALGGAEAFARGAVEAEPDDDTRWWGLALAPDLLLVPTPMPVAWIPRIAHVSVEDAGDPVIPAEFEGRLRGLGAFVIRLHDAIVDPLPAEQPQAPAAERAFLVHRAAWRAGARRDVVEYDRSLGSARGYGDRSYLVSEQPVPSGSFLLDLEGRVVGFAADLLPEDVERGTARGRRDEDGARGVVAALFAERGAPANLTKELDRRVMPAASSDGRRLPWLGVEYEPVRGPAVAEALDVSGPTRDGARGLLVNAVYEGSPAAKAGLRVDDILLSARRTSGPGSDAPPVDLRDVAGTVDWGDDSEVPRPWAPRQNALVRLLDLWGVGTSYELELQRGTETQRLALAVEASPRDVSTAHGVREEATGLSIKELTYEVRHALHLAPDAPGVLVARVEEGSPAYQARILANEVLRELDGKPVTDPETFLKLLAKARADGRPQVRAVILHLDRSRFVDLRVVEAAPPTPR